MMMAQRPVRSAGRAFLLCNSRDGGMRQESRRSYWVGFAILLCLFLSAVPIGAQHDEQNQTSVQQAVSPDYQHHGTVGQQAGWEGSVAGIAYSEFNHHLSGILILIIGLSEVRQALAMPYWAWTRLLLPGALLACLLYTSPSPRDS